MPNYNKKKTFFKLILNFWNFLLPQIEIPKEKIFKLLENRVLFFLKDNHINLLPYQNKDVSSMIWSLKFKKNKKVAFFLAELLYQNIPELLIDLQILKSFNNPIIITIPMTFSKKIKRGYNQNDLIIQNFQKLSDKKFLKWEKKILKKTKNTIPQSHIKNRQARIDNIKNCFSVSHKIKIKGKNILLFDDIKTTGATLNEAKKVLKKAGAKKIITLTIAH